MWSTTLLPFLSVRCLTGLVVLFDCFFNFVVVGVPCSLIFWHFWLFIDFRLAVILPLVVGGSEGFLPTPPSRLEPLGSGKGGTEKTRHAPGETGDRGFGERTEGVAARILPQIILIQNLSLQNHKHVIL